MKRFIGVVVAMAGMAGLSLWTQVGGATSVATDAPCVDVEFVWMRGSGQSLGDAEYVAYKKEMANYRTNRGGFYLNFRVCKYQSTNRN